MPTTAEVLPTSGDNTANTPTNRNKARFDWRWLCIGLIMLVLIIVALVLNFNRPSTSDSTSQLAGTIEVDNGDLKINWDQYVAKDITLADNLTITTSGIYHLTGAIDDGSITINVGDNGVVKLILDSVTINNSNGPAINCVAADDLVIELSGDNYLSDGSRYSAEYDTDITGVVYSKGDLTFQGEGSLTVTGNYQDGIVGKDDLKFNSGTYSVTAADDGVRGTDSVYIIDGSFAINSTADAIKSTNETTTGKGFVLIENGDFNLAVSAKGIKAINTIMIYNGNFVINSYDDAIHSNSYVGIVNGNFNVTSGDDGMHADRTLVIDGGNIIIAKSYEGLEAQAVTINNGNISITSSDDGINAGGGNDGSANNRPGAGAFAADENCILSINGGDLYINAGGDGVDSNGWLHFNGGNVAIDGPTNNGNGALDSGMGIVMNGGTVIAIGASGMAETLGSSSAINNISIYLSSSAAAKTKIEIKNSAGDTIISHTSAKNFNHIAVGSPEFILGDTYTLYLDDVAYDTFTVSGITTTVGNSNTNQNMMPSDPSGGAPANSPANQPGNRR